MNEIFDFLKKTVTFFCRRGVLMMVFALVTALGSSVQAQTVTIEISQSDVETGALSIQSRILTALNNLTNTIIEVTGSKTNVANGMTLAVSAGQTLLWNAVYTGNSSTGTMILQNGFGTLEVGSDGIISNSSNYNTITTNGSVNVNGGTVIATGNGNAIHLSRTENDVVINGGTVKAADGYAIIGGKVAITNAADISVTGTYYPAISAAGEVTVSGNSTVSANGGAAINSANHVTVSSGTVSSVSNAAIRTADLSSTLTVSGGEVFSTTGNAIYANSNVNIIGGKVYTTVNAAIFSFGPVSVSGGFVFAWRPTMNGVNGLIYIYPSGTPTISGDGVVAAWNNTAGTFNYIEGTDEDLAMNPAGALTWHNNGTDDGVSWVNGSNTGFHPINGVTVTGGITTYTVDYDANGGSGAPTDNKSPYATGSLVAVLDDTGMTNSGFDFTAWNTASDGSGATFKPGENFTITDNTTLYAQWTAVTVVPGVPIITSADNYTCEEGKGGSFVLTATGDAPITWSLPFSPIGVSLNDNILIIDASVTEGTYLIKVCAANGRPPDASQTFTLTVTAATTTFSVDYDANGGSGAPSDNNSPYAIGSLVTVLDDIGMANPGFDFAAWNTASDGNGATYKPGETFTITANVTLYAQWAAVSSDTSPTITTTSLPDGEVLWSYSETLAANGTTPVTWTLQTGMLPDGLTLNSATGKIAGTPSRDGTFSFTVKATNDAGSDTKLLNIQIDPLNCIGKISQGHTVDEIEEWIQGALSLAVCNTVTIIGSKTNVSSSLVFEIPIGKTLVWDAIYTGNDGDYDRCALIENQGDGGTIIIESNALIENSGNNATISTPNILIMNGGSVKSINGTAIYTGRTVTINDGTISTSEGIGIYTEGTCTVTGNSVVEVTGKEGTAILSTNEKNVTVSGNASISAQMNVAISMAGSRGDVFVSGGTVTATSGYAIFNPGGNVTVSGGTVTTTKAGTAIHCGNNVTVSETGVVSAITNGSVAIEAEGNVYVNGGVVFGIDDGFPIVCTRNTTVSGGFVFAYGTGINDIFNVTRTLDYSSGMGVVCAWDIMAGRTEYDSGTSTHLFVRPNPDASAIWFNTGTESGIKYQNGANSGFFPLAAVTVTGGVTTYTVAYDANGGSGAPTDSNSPYASGATVTVLDYTGMTNPGYDFDGWNTVADGSGTAYSPNETFTITDDVTLYAQWKVTTVPPMISNANPPNGTIGTAYSATLRASGDTPITWTIIIGALPNGLTLNASTGVISGTPETEGAFTFTVKATNSAGDDTRSYTLRINAAPVVKTVVIGDPTGTLLAGEAQTVTFPVTTSNIANGQTGTVQWHSDTGAPMANAPAGLTATLGNVHDNAAVLTVISTPQAIEGKYLLNVTVDGVTSDFAILPVGAAVLQKTITIGSQINAIQAGEEGIISYMVTTTNIPDGMYYYSISGLPQGVSESSDPTTNEVVLIINNQSCVLYLKTNSSTEAGTTNSLQLTLIAENVHSNAFTLTIGAENSPFIAINRTYSTITVVLPGTINVSIKTSNILDGMRGTVQWLTSQAVSTRAASMTGDASTRAAAVNEPKGISVTVSDVLGGEATITIAVTGEAVPGTYYFHVVIDGVSTPVITLNISSDVTANDAITQHNTLKAWTANGILYVSGLKKGEVWYVYSIAGTIIYTGVANDEQSEIALPGRGIYIVRTARGGIKVNN